MKTHKRESLFAFALVALAVPTTLLGVAAVSAASELNNPKSTQFELFDADKFRILRRKAREDRGTPVKSETKHEAPKTLVPCEPSSEDNGETATETEAKLRYDDLSDVEKDALRKQLRIGGCPQDALPGYKALCEAMLKTQEAKKPLKGLKHPSQ